MEIFANHMLGKGLVSKVHKEHKQFNSKIISIRLPKNGQRNQIGIFPKKTYEWSIDMQKCSYHL